MIYKDDKQPIEKRVNDLLNRMTLEEKVAQLCCIMPQMIVGEEGPDIAAMSKYIHDGLGRITQFSVIHPDDPKTIAEYANTIQKFAIDKTRLGIPVLFQTEGANGLVAVDAVVFPAGIGMAATWNPELIRKAADIISQQAKAAGIHKILAPVLDLALDPRWGRVSETFGEDPYLVSAMAEGFVNGLQGKDLTKGVVSCAKHFLAYGFSEAGMHMADVHIGDRMLHEVFGRPFETAIQEAGMRAVMCTYASIDGEVTSVSPRILRQLLRDKMGFSGSAICDGSSIEYCVEKQHVAQTLQEAGVMALKAGLDADTPVTQAFDKLPEAVRKGMVEESYIDEAVSRVLTMKFELGLFEKPFVDSEKTKDIFMELNDRNLALNIAQNSIVMLKNESHTLPISKDIASIAVIGPQANNLLSSFGGYNYPTMVQIFQYMVKRQSNGPRMVGVSDRLEKDTSLETTNIFAKAAKRFGDIDIDSYTREHYQTATLLESIKSVVSNKTEVHFAKGCDVLDMDESGFAEAIQIVEKSDIVIMAMGDRAGLGSKSRTSGEGLQATSLELPTIQQKFLETISPLGKPIVMVLFNSRPINLNWATENIDAILVVWAPGQEGSDAITSIIFGEANPSGKLPITFPKSVGQVPIYHFHKVASGYKELPDRKADLNESIFGMKNIDKGPLYPFGFGLSFSEFMFSDLVFEPEKVDINKSVRVSCKVKNISDIAGDEIIQVYIHDREAHIIRPVHELVAFRRVSLEPGEQKEVIFDICINQLGFYDENMRFVVEPGNMDVEVGNSSEDIHLRGSFEIIGKKKEILLNRSYLANSSEK